VRRLPMQISDRPDLRAQGAIVGFLIAGTVVGAELLRLLGQPHAVSVFLTDGVPALVAGLIGGWLLAPRAARASTRREWLGVVLRLGVVAVIVGAMGMGIAMGAESALNSRGGPGQAILSLIVGGPLLGLLGVVLLGWMVLPLTTLAAGIWAFVMARVLRQAPGRAR
jgi:hypothetical protein